MNEHTLRSMPKFNKSETSSVLSDKDKDRFKKRQIANNNERRRMRFINLGFQHLRNMLPYYMTSEKMSKANVLSQACERIKSLEEELAYCKSTAPTKPCSQCGFSESKVVSKAPTKRLFIRMSDNVQCENVEPNIGAGGGGTAVTPKGGTTGGGGANNIGRYLLYAAKQIELDNLSPSFHQQQTTTAMQNRTQLSQSVAETGTNMTDVSVTGIGPKTTGMVPGRRKYRVVIPQSVNIVKGREAFFEMKDEAIDHGLEEDNVVMVRETCVDPEQRVNVEGGEEEDEEGNESGRDGGASDAKKQRILPPKLQHKSQYKNEVVMVI